MSPGWSLFVIVPAMVFIFVSVAQWAAVALARRDEWWAFPGAMAVILFALGAVLVLGAGSFSAVVWLLS